MAKTNQKTTYSEVIGEKMLLLTALIEGAVVMGAELLGAKFIEPYFGSSLYTWCSVLAVTLFGLAGGYYLGGILSKKYDEIEILYKSMGVAAILIASMPFIGPWVMEFMLFSDIRTASVISSLIFIFPIMFCLGITSPLIITALSSSVQNTGKFVGTTFAIATLGGVITTISLGFFLIPSLGLRICAVTVAMIAVTAPIVVFLKTRNLKSALAFLSITALLTSLNIVSVLSAFPTSKHFNVIHKSDGLAGQLLVIDYIKKETRLLYVNNISQSYSYLPTGRSAFLYVHRIAAYSSYKPPGSKVLLAGLGGGQMVNEFEILGFEIDACDIDPRMEMIAKQYFNMTDKVNVITDDFRHTIRTTKTKYDIIAIDISAGETQPNNLYTLEAFQDMKSVLKSDGVLFIHYPSAYNSSMGTALKSIGRTLKEAGYTIDLLNTTSQFDILQEYVYFASVDGTRLSNLDFSRRDTFALPYKFPTFEGVVFAKMKFDKGFVLTDDKPMMDILHSELATSYRVQMQPIIKSALNEGIRFH